MSTLLVAAVLSACSPMPLDRGRSYPIVQRTPLASEVAFARLEKGAAACYSRGNPRLLATYSPATRSGRLVVSSGITTLAVELAQIDIDPDVSGSVVLMRLQGDAGSDFAAAVGAWLRAETPRCPYTQYQGY